MNKKIFVAIFSFTALLMICGIVNAQATMDSLMEKVGTISVDGKTSLEILQQISQEGELDASVPKTTITKDGRTETIFVFEIPGDPDEALGDFQDYFIREENFQMIDYNYQEDGGMKAVELAKGTSVIILVSTGNIMVESRQEDAVILPQAPAVEGGKEGVGLGGMPSWTWIVIAGVIVLIIIIIVIKKISAGKK